MGHQGEGVPLQEQRAGSVAGQGRPGDGRQRPIGCDEDRGGVRREVLRPKGLPDPRRRRASAAWSVPAAHDRPPPGRRPPIPSAARGPHRASRPRKKGRAAKGKNPRPQFPEVRVRRDKWTVGIGSTVRSRGGGGSQVVAEL